MTNNGSDSDVDEKKISDTEDKDEEDKERDDKKMSANKLLQLPVSRIKTIMKSSPELGNVSPESYFLITRATELFVKYLAKNAYETAGKSKSVEYKALSKLVSTDESLDFLEEIVPFKIKMSDYWAKYGRPAEIHDDDDVPLKSPKAQKSIVNNTPKKDATPKTPEVICID